MRGYATTEADKAATYDWYGLEHPANNSGPTQTCELDHLISLELGGADTLDNIWPQCGPDGVAFKQKDMVENYLARQVRAGAVDLSDVRRGLLPIGRSISKKREGPADHP